jgi:hypothetical protein
MCVGGGVAQFIDLTERCRHEVRGLDWGRSKDFMFIAPATPVTVSHPACYPAVTNGCHTGNKCPGLAAGVSTAYNTDVSYVGENLNLYFLQVGSICSFP